MKNYLKFSRTAFGALALAFLTIGFSACEKDDDSSDQQNNTSNNNGGSSGNTSELENNTAKAGDESGQMAYYTASVNVDVNSNEEYLDIFVYDNLFARNNTFQLTLHEVLPTASTTLSWQKESNAPGHIKANEFSAYLKVNGNSWYNPYTSVDFQEDGEMEVTVNGDKITFEMKEMTLSDNYIVPNVTEEKQCAAKITLSIADINQSIADYGSEQALINE
tara:strand:- start:3002 stop:3661 length:660 start_codon:yes stop_codon:yes gene_type:complete